MLIPLSMTKQRELMVDAGKGPSVRTPEPTAQDAFLDQMIRDRCTVLVYLKSGIRLTGALDSFDTFMITLRDGGSIYKHAITTIQPAVRRLSGEEPPYVRNPENHGPLVEVKRRRRTLER